jgi:Exoribonuclease R
MAKNPLFNLDTIATQAMLERGFVPGYPPSVVKETEELSLPSIPIPGANIRDLRKLLWFSIDNDDSRDLDQLTYAEAVDETRYHVYIAVAGVDLLVKKDSAIDNRASNNTTSVYTPTKIFPMLPEKLSTDLTSLNPNVDRVALVFEGVLATDGELQDYSIYQAYVHNYAQLAYDATSTWLDGGQIPEIIANTKGLEDQIRLQDSIAKKLTTLRHKLGALTLTTIEPKAVLDDGIPVALKVMPANRGRKLIEHFMIVANMISAKYAEKNNLSFIRRVVTNPKRWDKIVAVAKEYGHDLPETPDSVALEEFLVKQKAADVTSFPDLSLVIIKLLGRGEYKVVIPGKNVPGHFGLALRDYSHSTAPNRRYPDLIIQRILLAALQNDKPPYSSRDLENLANRCTMKEDDADKVERRMRKSAAALVLEKDIGKEFDGIITGAGEKGTWVRIFNPPVEGKVVKGIDNIDVGDMVRVKLLHTDVLAGFIDFAKVGSIQPTHSKTH